MRFAGTRICKLAGRNAKLLQLFGQHFAGMNGPGVGHAQKSRAVWWMWRIVRDPVEDLVRIAEERNHANPRPSLNGPGTSRETRDHLSETLL
jgi:hypothetical protein